MSNYTRGLRQEKRTRAWLEALGYWCIEARGSHGPADLVAINETGVRVIQVKSGEDHRSKETRRAEMARLLAIPVPPNGTREIVRWRRYGRVPEVEMVEERDLCGGGWTRGERIAAAIHARGNA